jgi:hypothetical protein
MSTSLSGLYLGLCLILLISACTSPSTAPSTEQRSIYQNAETRVCTEKQPASYTSSVENRLKAELPLLGTTQAQAEGTVRSYLEQKSGGTRRGEDLASYLFYICQMANNGGWNQDRTERLIALFIDKWPGEEREATVPNSKCMQQLQNGYALKDQIDEGYWHSKRAGTIQDRSEQLLKKWDTNLREWTVNTEAMLVEIGGPIERGRFRNARIPATALANTNMKWNGIRNALHGRLDTLEAICKETAVR